jgi:hypothetical protein
MCICTYSRQFSPILYIRSRLNPNLYRQFSTLLVFNFSGRPLSRNVYFLFALYWDSRGRILRHRSMSICRVFEIRTATRKLFRNYTDGVFVFCCKCTGAHGVKPMDL